MYHELMKRAVIVFAPGRRSRCVRDPDAFQTSSSAPPSPVLGLILAWQSPAGGLAVFTVRVRLRRLGGTHSPARVDRAHVPMALATAVLCAGLKA